MNSDLFFEPYRFFSIFRIILRLNGHFFAQQITLVPIPLRIVLKKAEVVPFAKALLMKNMPKMKKK